MREVRLPAKVGVSSHKVSKDTVNLLLPPHSQVLLSLSFFPLTKETTFLSTTHLTQVPPLKSPQDGSKFHEGPETGPYAAQVLVQERVISSAASDWETAEEKG